MLSYPVYFVILYGTLFVLIGLGFLVLFKLPLQRLVDLLESVFHFKKVRNLRDEHIVIDVCHDKFELSKSFSSRFPFVIALGMCLLVTIIVFIEGCIFSTRVIYGKKLCAERMPYCYLFRTRFTSFEPFQQFSCEPDHPVIPTNVTANHAVCYGFVLPEQTSIDLLNQLGVCTGILALVDSLYPLAYRFGRQKKGRAVLLVLLFGMLLVEILVLSQELNISMITIILLTLTEVLILTILFLHYRKARGKDNLSRGESDMELNSTESTSLV